MGKLLFCFVIVVNSASAGAMIFTQASCGDVVVNGTASASCGEPFDFIHAFAEAGAGPTFARAESGSEPGEPASASASFEDDYVLTVTAGPPQGFFTVCISALSDMGGEAGGSFAGQGVGSIPTVPVDTCGPFGFHPPFITPTSFTLGVPIRSTLSLGAEAGSDIRGAEGEVDFQGFQFFDASMNPISDVTYTLVEVPEPAVVFLLISALLGLLFLKRSTARHNSKRG